MKRLSKKLLGEARKMEGAWVKANPGGDREWILREIAGTLQVSFERLQRKLGKSKRKKKKHLTR